MAKPQPWDYVIIAIHFVITVFVGLWSGRQKKGSTTGYFLAGRSMHWLPVGLSLYVSNIGAASFFGIAGASVMTGISVICYEFGGLFNILLLGFLFVPVYIASGVYTMPEYLQKRFRSRRLPVYLAVQAMILFVFTKLSAEIYTGALLVQETLAINKYLAIVILLVVTSLYTMVGGLSAVIYTDALQSVVLLIGGAILSAIAMEKVGGYEAMWDKYDAAVPNYTLHHNTSCGLPDPLARHIFRPASDPNYPWPGVVFGSNILSAWYFCTDQVLVQRMLSAKNLNHARAGSILAALLKVVPFFIMVLPGIVARSYYADSVACADPDSCREACGIENGCSNLAYMRLILDFMPTGVRGLMLAAMLAGIMSSLTSIFNSGATVFTMDIWRRIRKQASELELMIVGRLFVLVFTGVSVAWLPVIDQAEGGQLFNYLQSINSYLAPPVLSCFLMGILWSRTNEEGAFWGLMVGLVFGLVRMIASFALAAPACGEPDTRHWLIKDVHYLHYAIFLFLLCCVVTGVVSLFTSPMDEKQLDGLTWWSKDRVLQKLEQELQQQPMEDVEEQQKELEEQPEQQQSEEPALPWRRRLIIFLCGASNKQNELSAEQQEARDRKLLQLALTEDVRVTRVVHVGAVCALSAGIFMWSFFA